jgi:hypothetical protein
MSVELDLSGVSVMLAMPVHRDLPSDTVISLLKTVAQLEARGMQYETHFQVGSSIIEAARSKCAHSFLEGPHSRMFWLDSDIRWEPDAFFRILALSTKYPVVGALYPVKEDTPTPFRFCFDGSSFDADEYGCFSVKGMGLGFAVMQRCVIEKLAEKAPKVRFPEIADPIPHIFRCDVENGFFRGEDIAMFSDIRALGYEVKLDPTITLGHVGSKTYTARMMDHLKAG